MGARTKWLCESCGRQLGMLMRMQQAVDSLRLARSIENVFFSSNTLTVLCPRCDAPTSYAQTWAQTAMGVG